MMAAAGGVAGLRSTHNSFLEELYDREALKLDAPEEIDTAMADSLERVAQLCRFTDSSLVLDVGCGSGAMSPFYESGGASLSRLTGLDLSAGMLARAKQSHPTAEWVKGDIHVFEDPNCRLFDRVVFNSCYQSLHDQEVALRHVTEELVSGGGLIVISEPRGKSYIEKEKKANPRVALNALPRKGTLEKLVEKLGGGTSGVHSFTSSLLSVDSVVDEEDFYCAILRRSCADF